MLSQITLPDLPSTDTDTKTDAGRCTGTGEGPLPGAVPASALSAAELGALVDASVDVVLVFDADGRYLRVVQTGREGLYRPVAEILGRRMDEVLPPELAARGHAAVTAALTTGRAQSLEYTLEFDGRTAWLSATVAPTAEGTAVWVARDVSAQRRAELALRESEAHFRAVFHQAGVGITILDADGRIVDVNPAFEQFIGYGLAELRGRIGGELSPPEDAAVTRGPVFDLKAGRVESVSVEKRFVRRDGTVRWAALTMSQIRAGDGRVGIVGLVQDITARKQAEETTARLTAVLELTPDVVAISAPNGRLEYVNRAGRELLGLGDALPAAALTVADVQPELVRGGALAGAVRAALRDGQWRGEATLRKRDGRELPVEQILLAHRGPDGAPDYLSTVLRDITERKQVEVALRDLALVDELTGLYNRRGFMAMAEQEWRRARRGGWPVLAFYADLDDFKAINDSYGHAEGDTALKAVAALLRATFREADVLGRPGGDEFTVLVPHADPGTEAAVLARIEERLAAHNAASRRPYALSLSVGVARAEVGDDGSLADLITRADAALYERKRLKPRVARG